MGKIYKITNTINNKIYIGKTKRDIKLRLQEHIRDSNNPDKNIPLHQAIKKYGKENFIIEIIEDNIIDDELDNKEKYYIQLFHSLSHENGYNVTQGGDGGKTHPILTLSQVNEIIKILQDKENLLSFYDIGKQYQVSCSTIAAINNGKSWPQVNISYPIRKYDTTGLTITRTIYQNIVNDIINTTLTLKQIQQKYNLSEGQMTAINQGQHCYKNHPYYKGVYEGEFPIRKIATQSHSITKDNFTAMLYKVIFSNNSIRSIAFEYGVLDSTFRYIILGKRRKELTKDFIFPIRKHIEENKIIFLNKFPNFKGDD